MCVCVVFLGLLVFLLNPPHLKKKALLQHCRYILCMCVWGCTQSNEILRR